MSFLAFVALCFFAVLPFGSLKIDQTLRNFLAPWFEASRVSSWISSFPSHQIGGVKHRQLPELENFLASLCTSDGGSDSWLSEIGATLVWLIQRLGELVPRHFQVGDSGPIYTETVLGHPPVVEPLNSLSNFIFLWIIWRWWKRNREFGPYSVTRWGLPIMFASFIGGTVYHATRSHEFWYLLDWIPIYGLAMGAAAYLWTRLAGVKRGWAIFGSISSVLIVLNVAADLWSQWETVTLISLSYGSLVVANLVPLVLHARLPAARGARRWLVAGVLIMVLAIGFRQLDVHIAHHHLETWPYGTHFMWHLLGGLAVNCMLEYLWRADWRPHFQRQDEQRRGQENL